MNVKRGAGKREQLRFRRDRGRGSERIRLKNIRDEGHRHVLPEQWQFAEGDDDDNAATPFLLNTYSRFNFKRKTILLLA